MNKEHKKLIVGISSRALFNLDESHAVCDKDGVDAYRQHQIQHENEILEPGSAFSLVKKFLSLNGEAKDSERVEVVLLSRNSADTGLRVFNSIQHYGLDISRAAFANGNTPHKYVPAFGVDLFLSAEPIDVRAALDMGVAAATILPTKEQSSDHPSSPLKIAFDGDAVLFSDEAEQVFQKEGLEAFNRSEKESSDKPLAGGPFAGFYPLFIGFKRNFHLIVHLQSEQHL